MTEDKEIINVKNFKKYFGKTKVIDDLSFSVMSGEIFAFLGANGSGKTTTLRCLLGIYEADEGQLFINGKKYTQDDSYLLGYLPEERGLYVTSRVLETLIYFGRIKGMEYDAAKKFSLNYLERVGLADKANLNINKLSSGQQQKIQLGITIINSPKLLILDEPTKGLDPVNRSLLLEILMELNKSGSTIIFSTHQMEEAEKIADRLLMIKNGKSVLYGNIEEIKKSFGNNSINVVFEGRLPENNNLFSSKINNHTATLTPNKGIHSNEILKYLIYQNLELIKYEVSAPSLNDIFIKVYGQNE
ncbi:MAG: ATP-binding cassette domain-containing protein [bacterium]